MMSICYRYFRNTDDARSLVNQSFLKMLDNLNKYNTTLPFDSWLKRITVNTCIDEYRKNARDKQVIDFVEPENLNEYELNFDIGAAEKKINISQLESAIDTLPETSKKVFLLFAVDGFAHKEIGEMLGISEGTSKWHVNAARTKLKELLAGKLNHTRRNPIQTIREKDFFKILSVIFFT